MTNRHNWNNFEQYLHIHQRYIAEFQARQFIIRDTLDYTMTPEAVVWKGMLYCAGGIRIEVSKLQDVRHQSGRLQVKTRQYAYHVMLGEGDATVNLFRYDNVHLHAGHTDRHHRHRYDESGQEIEPTSHIGEDSWPTLSDVVGEAEQWWEAHLRKAGSSGAL